MAPTELLLWWEPRDPAIADDAARLAKFVSGLPSFDTDYCSWISSRKAKKSLLPMPMNQQEAKQCIQQHLSYYDDGRLWPELGSHFRSANGGPLPCNRAWSQMPATSWNIGAYNRTQRYPNNVFMNLSEARPSTGRPWRASELRPLMKFAREVWSPAQMCAIPSFYSSYFPTIPDPSWAQGYRSLEPWIGWITYLPPDLAARAKYPADVEVERLADGAALVTLCEEPFGKYDNEQIAKLRALEAAMRPIQS